MLNDRYYIGGGSIAAILGISPFSTPLDAYHLITGGSKELDQQTERFFQRRKSLEPFIACTLQDRGLTVEKMNERYTDSEFPFFKAEIDAETADGVYNEFKSVSPYAAASWGIEDNSDNGAPAYVIAQAMWGLGIQRKDAYEAPSSRIIAAIGFDESRAYPVERSADQIAWLRSKARAFWEQHVLPEVPPPVTTLGDVLNWVTPDPNRSIEATDHSGLVTSVRDFLEARQRVKDGESELETLKTRIQLAMAEATTLTLDGKAVLSWKPNKDSVVTDWRGLALEIKPGDELVARFTTTKPGARVFRVLAK